MTAFLHARLWVPGEPEPDLVGDPHAPGGVLGWSSGRPQAGQSVPALGELLLELSSEQRQAVGASCLREGAEVGKGSPFSPAMQERTPGRPSCLCLTLPSWHTGGHLFCPVSPACLWDSHLVSVKTKPRGQECIWALQSGRGSGSVSPPPTPHPQHNLSAASSWAEPSLAVLTAGCQGNRRSWPWSS